MSDNIFGQALIINRFLNAYRIENNSTIMFFCHINDGIQAKSIKQRRRNEGPTGYKERNTFCEDV